MSRLMRRRAKNLAAKIISTTFAAVSLGLLAWILGTLVAKGFPALGTDVFTKMMPAAGEKGGLLNAIVGSLVQVGVALLIGAPIGVFAGTFLAEMGQRTRLAGAVRFVNDILLSAPSILIGLFVYQIVVRPTGGFSGWAGAIALAILILPVVVRATEDMLSLVPTSLREAAFALGAPQWKVVTLITWRAAKAGIATGILLALARASGETAPLLFTSLGDTGWSLDLTEPMASLPRAIYDYAGSTYDELVALAWAGALVITLAVLAINILTRIALVPKSRRT